MENAPHVWKKFGYVLSATFAPACSLLVGRRNGFDVSVYMDDLPIFEGWLRAGGHSSAVTDLEWICHRVELLAGVI